jgi:hypothetical protein
LKISDIELEVLRLNREANGYQMPEQAIINQLTVRLRPPPTVLEIKTALRNLETNLQILGVRTEDAVKYGNTSRGTARLAEAEMV